jgi:uncharacterized protein YecE (DUF72 family)
MVREAGRSGRAHLPCRLLSSQPMQIHVGASLDRPPGPKYSAALSFAELRFPSSRPKTKSLERWRSSVSEDFIVSIMAPKACTEGSSGPFKLDPVLEAELDWLGLAARATRARAIVLPTHRAISTGARDRERLAKYVEALRTRVPEAALVWQPGGLWDLELAAPQAEKLGVTLAIDPLDAETIPDTSLVYLRIVAIGARSRISPGMSIEVVERLREHHADEAFVVIHSERSVREAGALAALLAGDE